MEAIRSSRVVDSAPDMKVVELIAGLRRLPARQDPGNHRGLKAKWGIERSSSTISVLDPVIWTLARSVCRDLTGNKPPFHFRMKVERRICQPINLESLDQAREEVTHSDDTVPYSNLILYVLASG